MRRRLCDLVEFIAHRIDDTRITQRNICRMNRFETPPHGAVLRTRTAMQFRTLAIAQKRLQRGEHGGAQTRHPDQDVHIRRHRRRYER